MQNHECDLEKLDEKRAEQWLKLYKKVMDARDEGDEKALVKAREAIRQYEEKDAIFKEKLRRNGFY